MQTTSTTDMLLLALLGEVRALRRDLAARAEPIEDTGATLLLAIADAVGSRIFTVAELLAHAEPADQVQLRAAIVRAVGGMRARSLGKLLARLEGRPAGGVRVLRVSTERSGILWQVLRD